MGVREGIQPRHTLEPRIVVKVEGCQSGFVKIASEGQALEIRAAPHEPWANVFNDHLADIRKSSAFVFECRRDRIRVANSQQFQPSKVWQLKQGVNELLHQVFWGMFKV